MTIFEKIIAREIPAEILMETDELIAFRDVAPVAPVHILVVPKRRINTANDLTSADAELLGSLILAAKELAAREQIAEDGYRLVINCNENGGQSVDHLHLHIIGGRRMDWPPG